LWLLKAYLVITDYPVPQLGHDLRIPAVNPAVSSLEYPKVHQITRDTGPVQPVRSPCHRVSQHPSHDLIYRDNGDSNHRPKGGRMTRPGRPGPADPEQKFAVGQIFFSAAGQAC